MKTKLIVGGIIVAGSMLLLAGKDMSDKRVNDDINSVTLNEIYDRNLSDQIEKFGEKTKCVDQTIIGDCDTSEIDYNEPIYNGLQRNRSRCTYLYDADAEQSNFNYYECGGGEGEPDNINIYKSSTNELINADDIEY